MRSFICVLSVLSSVFGYQVFGQAPIITSFSPTIAEVGATVTITGTNFSTTPSSNVVYFGGARATVLSASATVLTVTVPNGSTRDFISVTKGGLTAYSRRNFNLFNSATASITGSYSFGGDVLVSAIATTTSGLQNSYPGFDVIIGAADFDNDGWPDIFKAGNTAVSVNRNLLTSTSATIASNQFSAPSNFTVTGSVRTIVTADIDSDGKLDIITGSSSGISILRNTSTSGTISFAAAVNISTVTTNIRVADFDLDGKLDIAAVNDGNLNIFKNTTTASITFNSAVATALSATGFTGIDLGDLNNDGKIDIVASKNGVSTNVIVNNSTVNTLALSNSFTINNGTYYPIVDDFDKDGIVDIYTWNRFFKNNYSTGTLSSSNFAEFTNNLVDEGGLGISAPDFNADGYPEIVLGSWWSHFWLYRNAGTGVSNSMFSGRQTVGTGGNAIGVDLNGDQKIDIISSNHGNNSGNSNIRINQNTMTPTSVITVNSSMSTFNKCNDIASSVQSFTVSGNGLQAGIVITPPSGFEISTVSTFASNVGNSATPLSLVGSAGTLSTTTIFVRMQASANNATYPAANIVCSSSGATSQNVSCQGTTTTAPTITATTPSSRCGSGTVTLGATASAGIVNWYTASTGGSAVSTGTSYTTPSISSTTTYFVDATNNACTTASRTAVVATVNPAVSISGSSTVAVGSTISLSGTGSPASSNPWISSALAVATVNSSGVVTGLSAGNSTITYTANTGCSATLVVTSSIIIPIITSFTPSSGAVGSSVTFTGFNFNGTASNNFVTMGGVRLAVTAATTTSLTVTIPAGAQYGPFQVTDLTNGRMGRSKTNFFVTNSNTSSISTLGAQSFANAVNTNTIASGNLGTFGKGTTFGSADIDGDGFQDVVIGGSSNIAVHRNTSTSGNISFAVNVNVATGSSSFIRELAIEDLNGDGKKDIVIVTGDASNSIKVFKNTSTPGSISFDAFYSINVGGMSRLKLGDADADGFVDIFAAGSYSSSVTIVKNTSTISTLSYGSTVSVGGFGGMRRLSLADVNRDGFLDIVGGNGSTTLVSTACASCGAISYSSPVSLTGAPSYMSAVQGDFNSDGKNDIMVQTECGGGIFIGLNSNTSGTISTGDFSFSNVQSTCYGFMEVGDFNGDAKLDYVEGADGSSLGARLNTWTSGAYSSSSFQGSSLNLGNAPQGMLICDFDNDNKSDVLSRGEGSSTFSVFRNTIAERIFISGALTSFTPCSGVVSTAQSISVSGSGLTTGIVFNAFSGIEYSTNGTTFSSTLTLGSTGNLAATTVYIRTTSSASSFSGNISVTTTGDSKTLAVSGTPIVVTTVISGTSTICAGGSTTLTASGASTYSWSNSLGTGASVSVSPSTTTTYTVTGTGASGCSDSESITVTVNALPSVSINGTTAVCPGGSTVLTASGGSSYVWNNSSTTSSITVSPSTPTTYSVTGTGANGCTNTASSVVTINEVPSITSQNTPAESICQNATASAMSVTATGTGLTYQWYSNETSSNTGGTIVSGATSSSFTPSTSSLGTKYYYCVVGGTCSPSVTSDVSGDIAVQGPLAGTISVSGGSSVCSGSSKTLTLSGHSGSIQWQSSANNSTWTDISGSTEPIFNTGALNATTYYRAKLTSGSCSAVYTSAEVITVISLPSVSISGNTTICNGSSTTLTASGASTYAWSNGAGSTAAVTLSPTTTTSYTVTGTSTGGCTGTATVTVTVNTPVYSYNNTNDSWETVSNWNVSCDQGATYSVATSEPTTPSIAFVNNGQTVTTTDLTISSGNQVIVKNGGKLTVAGVLTNNGTLKVESGGSLLQTLGSTQSGTGAYIAERELSGTGSSTPTGRFWYTGVPMTGATSTSFLASGPNKLWSHNESTGAYEEIDQIVQPIVQGKGYVFRGVDNNGVNGNKYAFNSTNIGNGNFTYNLTRSTSTSAKPGFNLISNPYPSHMSWNDLYATASLGTDGLPAILPTIWYRTLNTVNVMAFDTYNYDGGVGTNNSGAAVTGIIAPFQSFWVRVAPTATTATMTATNAMRSHGTQSFLTLTPAIVRLNLSNGLSHDESIVFVKDDLSNDYDYRDSGKEIPSATVHQLYSLEGTNKVAINGIANALLKDTLQLGLQIPTSGTYSINCTEHTFSDLVYLEDKITDAYIELSNTTTYSFTSEAGTFNNRFVLHFASVPALPGQTAATAIAMPTSNWPQCNNVTSEDAWHAFTATTEAISIAVNTASADVVIELQDGTGNVVAQENAVSGIGNETLNFYGLIAGQTYKVGVHNNNTSQPTGTYGICVKSLKRGGCDYGVGPYSLCQYYKATWAGSTGVSYTFTFTGTSGPATGQTFTRTQSSDICVLSTVTPLLPYGSTYSVVISNTYTLTDGAGNTEQITVPSNSACQVITIAEPQTTLNANSSCNNGPRFRGSVVSSAPWICGASNWRWRFTEVNPLTLQAVGLPIELNRGAASNFLSLGTVNQLQSGKTYAVRTAPVFNYTGTNYNWGPTQYMCIVGAAGMTLEGADATQGAEQGSAKDALQDATQELHAVVYVTEGTQLNIQLSNAANNTAKRADIYDVTGKCVKSIRLVEGMNQVELSEASGIYMVRTTVGNQTETHRVFIQK
jgi:hypothetical protein